jgi:hypothetical protein
MLRITVHDDPKASTVQLEGTLMGPWVREAEVCLQQTRVRPHTCTLRLDLTGVTTIDAAGKSFLAAAHSEGANIVASGCLMKAIVAEVTGIPERHSILGPSGGAGMR